MMYGSIKEIEYGGCFGYCLDKNKTYHDADTKKLSNNCYIDGKVLILGDSSFDVLNYRNSIMNLVSLVDIEGISKFEEYSAFEYNQNLKGDSYYLIVDNFKRVYWYRKRYFTEKSLKEIRDLDDSDLETLIFPAKEFVEKRIKQMERLRTEEHELKLQKEAEKEAEKLRKINENKKAKENEVRIREEKSQIKAYSEIFSSNIKQYTMTELVGKYCSELMYIPLIMFVGLSFSIVIPNIIAKLLILVVATVLTFLPIRKIMKKQIKRPEAIGYLEYYKSFTSFDDALLSRIIRLILLVNDFTNKKILTQTLSEQILNTLIGMSNIYKNYNDITGKGVSDKTNESMLELVTSIEVYIETLISSNEEYKKLEQEKLDKLLADFAIKNKSIFNNMAQLNECFSNTINNQR